MGFVNKGNDLVINTILTTYGRKMLMSDNFNVKFFALSDDGIDYTNMTNAQIESLRLIEADPNYTIKNFIYLTDPNLSESINIESNSVQSTYKLDFKGKGTSSALTINPKLNNNLPVLSWNCIILNGGGYVKLHSISNSNSVYSINKGDKLEINDSTGFIIEAIDNTTVSLKVIIRDNTFGSQITSTISLN